MDSTATAATVTASPPLLRPTPPRRPLQPYNHIPAASPPFKKKLALATPVKRGAAGKENASELTKDLEEVAAPSDVSLGEELGVARRRRDRLKQERETTEEVLRAVERALQRGFREMERRADEQRLVDLVIRWMVGMRSFSESPVAMPSTPTFQSLREKERERRTMEKMSQVVSISDEEEAAEGRMNDELSAGDKHLDTSLDTRTEFRENKGCVQEINEIETHTNAGKQEAKTLVTGN